MDHKKSDGGGGGELGQKQTFPQKIIDKKIYSYGIWPKTYMPKDEKKKISTLHLQKFVASLKILNPPIPTPPKKHLMVHALMVWREESASQFAN